jgi:hypothetical protein
VTRLCQRIERLEQSETEPLSPAARQWLGWPLTEAEESELAAGAGEAASPLTPKTARLLSPQAREWLGIGMAEQ